MRLTLSPGQVVEIDERWLALKNIRTAIQAGLLKVSNIDENLGFGLAISKGGSIHKPSGPVTVTAWRAPWPCLIFAIKARRLGGVSATANALKNESLTLAATDLVLPDNAWVTTTAVQNEIFDTGDSLDIVLVSVAGAVSEVSIQAEILRFGN